MRNKILQAVFMLAAVPALFGGGKVLVAQATGTGAMLIRNGSGEFLSFAAKNPKGMELFSGDILNLEPDSMMELVILPVNSRLQASESTSFRIRSVSQAGGYDVELYYGKLRATAISGIKQQPFSINNINVVPQQESADFGYDVYTDSGARGSSQQVYCFAGEVTVSRSNPASSAAGGTESVRLLAQEMARVREQGTDVPLAKVALGAATGKAWLGGTAVAVLPETAVTQQTEPAVIQPSTQITPSVVTNIRKPEGDTGTTPAATGQTSPAATGTEEKVPATSTAPESAKVTTTVRDTGDSTPVEKPEGTIPAAGTEKPATPEAQTKPATEAEQPKQAENAQQNQGGNAPVAFKLDMNMEFLYLVHDLSYLSAFAPYELLMTVLDTLLSLRVGLFIDPAIMFWNVIGIGIETGAMYAPLIVGSDYIHLISVPATVLIRLSIGPAYLQCMGGIIFDGAINQTTGEMVVNSNFRYEAGVRLGVKLGNSAFYASAILISDTVDGFFNQNFYPWLGVGIIFSIL